MTPDATDQIRQLAHKIWEDEGKPDGRAEAHWQMAQDMMQKTAAKAPKKSVTRVSRAKAKA
jgi:hypothetical protein